jgi:hypothetical protein
LVKLLFIHNLPDLQVLQDNDSSAQEIVNSLQLLELLAPTMNKILQEKVSDSPVQQNNIL